MLILGSLLARRKNWFYKRKFKKEFQLNFFERNILMKKRLLDLLKVASNKVPFYQKYNHILCNLNIENVEEILSELPIITKEDIFKSSQFKNIDLKDNLIDTKTNGSTGPSFIFCYDKESVDISSGITHACEELRFGKGLNYHQYISNYLKDSKSNKYKEKFKRFFTKKSIQSIPISYDHFEFETQLLPPPKKNKYILQGHPSTIKLLSRYLSKQNNNLLENCIAIESTGELLTNHDRKFIETILGLPIVDRYGLAEAGVVAYQLNRHTNFLKILDTLFYVEIDSDDYIILTSLTNYGMPLIRYNTGDKGKIITSGEGSKYLNITGGRKHDFITFQGLRISSSSIQEELSKIDNVYDFQILVDKKIENLKIILDTDNNISFQKAKNLLLKFLPENTVFEKEQFKNFKMSGMAEKFQRIIHIN